MIGKYERPMTTNFMRYSLRFKIYGALEFGKVNLLCACLVYKSNINTLVFHIF
uniref:Uncharacterized protein n=1 Tax=Arundo donax TaxID=35708 RepID=A0A0A9AI51_ARUDO